MENIKAHSKVSRDVSQVDTAFYLFYNYQNIQIDGVQGMPIQTTLKFWFLSQFHIVNWHHFCVPGSFKVASVNNITFTYPPSPLMSQIIDVPKEAICNGDKLPNNCDKKDGNVCQCIHVIDIDVGSVVELILVHQGIILHSTKYCTHSFI